MKGERGDPPKFPDSYSQESLTKQFSSHLRRDIVKETGMPRKQTGLDFTAAEAPAPLGWAPSPCGQLVREHKQQVAGKRRQETRLLGLQPQVPGV